MALGWFVCIRNHSEQVVSCLEQSARLVLGGAVPQGLQDPMSPQDCTLLCSVTLLAGVLGRLFWAVLTSEAAISVLLT